MTIFNLAAQSAMELPGAQSCAVVDLESGTCLGRSSNSLSANISSACFINAQVIRSKIRLVRELSPDESIQDIMITLDHHYHIIRVMDNKGAAPVLFLYLIVDRDTANLVMARRKLADIEQAFWRIPNIETQVSEASLSAILKTPAATKFIADDLDSEESSEDVPAFMRDEVVLKLLGMSPKNVGTNGSVAYIQ